MSKRAPSFAPRREGYNQRILQPLNCLVFIAPLLAFFQVGTAYYGTSLLAPKDFGKLLRYFGATATYLPAACIVVVLLIQHAVHGYRWKVHPKVLAGMVAESLVATAPLVAIFYLSGLLLAAGGTREEMFQNLFLAAGAGVYEEFLFRLMFVSLAGLVFIDIFELRKDAVILAAVVAGAVLFSLYHFTWAQFNGELAFPWRQFIFRATAGVYLGTLYVFRGFGVAVGAHTVYNIYVLFFSA